MSRVDVKISVLEKLYTPAFNIAAMLKTTQEKVSNKCSSFPNQCKFKFKLDVSKGTKLTVSLDAEVS